MRTLGGVVGGGWWVPVSRYHHSISRYTLMSSQPIGRHVCCSLKLPVTPSKVLLLFEDFPAVISSRWCLFIQMHGAAMLALLYLSYRRLVLSPKSQSKLTLSPIEVPHVLTMLYTLLYRSSVLWLVNQSQIYSQLWKRLTLNFAQTFMVPNESYWLCLILRLFL